ncbi:outer membrane protein [Candidatus Avelusimicrobium aviculae]|uniref:outer membrane protein n=1 Tax=Candidatus Avelusimicrobium aviculae TaxID=3416206 RepID=UPI003D0F868E
MRLFKIVFVIVSFLLPPCLFAQQYTVVNGQKEFADLADWGAYHGGEFSFGMGVTSSPNSPDGGGNYTKNGAVVGGTWLVTMTPHISSGFDYTYAGFRTPAPVQNVRYTLEAQEVFAAFKLKWDIAPRFRLYLPVGLGAAYLSLTQRKDGMELKRGKWAFAAYAGAGAEVDITPTVFAGVEYRYVRPFIQTGDLDPLAGSSRYFQMHHFFLRLGKRFS